MMQNYLPSLFYLGFFLILKISFSSEFSTDQYDEIIEFKSSFLL